MTKKNKKRILWVDDNSKGISSRFGEWLEEQGFDVRSVVSLDSAIYLLQNELFNIVITDMIFPAGVNAGLAGAYLINNIRNGNISKGIMNMPIIVKSMVCKSDIEKELNSNSFIYYIEPSLILEKNTLNHMVKIIEKS